jgi:ketosteroid isomerase-like protein
MLRTPQEFMSYFSQCVSRRALDSLMELYEPAAIFSPAPEVTHRGLSEIRAALAQMLALSPVMETRVVGVHEADNIALVFVEWSLRGTAPDGSVVAQGGKSADVLRRQADGQWRVLIDHP